MSGDHVNQAAQMGAVLQSMGVTGGGGVQGGQIPFEISVFKSKHEGGHQGLFGADINGHGHGK